MMATMSRIGETLLAMYEAMRERWGDRGWWPSAAGADTPEGKLEIAVGAVLTQNTNWRNVERAIGNLRAAGATNVAALHAMPHAELARLIRPAGYFNVKARRLKNLVAAVHEHGGDVEAFLDQPADDLRESLLAVRGIGRETADSIILYAAGKCTFVVDAYTFRILFRHGLVGPEDDYESVKELFESSLAEDAALWGDYHAQLVEVGKRYCRRRRALCAGCPLEPFPHDPDAGAEGW
jgi:endonuclease-3 related protein